MSGGREREEDTNLALKFDSAGLMPAMAIDQRDGTPLMLAYMNREAFDKTLETGEAHFYSRSRKELWHKGATSGNVLLVREVLIDCDQDAVVLRVEMTGDKAACHTGRTSCFYRAVTMGTDGPRLQFIEHPMAFSSGSSLGD